MPGEGPHRRTLSYDRVDLRRMLGEEGFALIGRLPLVNIPDSVTIPPTAIWILFQGIDSRNASVFGNGPLES